METDILTATDGAIDSGAIGSFFERVRLKSAKFESQLEAAEKGRPCPSCGDHATLDIAASWKAGDIAYTCAACEERRQHRQLGERIERAGIPADVRHATIANFQTARAGIKSGKDFPGHKTPTQFAEAVRAFLEKGTRNLILAGTPGIGKGHLAAAVAIHFIRKGWRVAWVECAKLFRDYHRAYAKDANEAITDRLGSVSLLVMDEICLRDLPADGEEILFAILDRRHKEGRPTVFLGNKPADEIRAWLGGRIVDRLRSGGVSFCYGEWESMRGSETDVVASTVTAKG